MKLIVLGANGRTGKLVVKAALDRWMHVTAMVRSTNKAPSFDRHRLTTVIGDPCDPDVLAVCRLVGQDLLGHNAAHVTSAQAEADSLILWSKP